MTARSDDVIRPLLCAIAISLALAEATSATTLVVLVGDRTVVVGADSRRTGEGTSETVCKVTFAGSVIFGFAGATNAESYDAISLARSELAKGGSVGSAVDRAVEAVRAGLAARLHQDFAAHPMEVRADLDRVNRMGATLQGFFAALIDGRPAVWNLSMRADVVATTVTVKARNVRWMPGAQSHLAFLNQLHDETDRLARSGRGLHKHPSNQALVGLARGTVRMDVDLEDQSPGVARSGWPITVAVLDKRGFRLVDGGACGRGGVSK